MERKLTLDQFLVHFLDLLSIDCPSVTQLNFAIGPKAKHNQLTRFYKEPHRKEPHLKEPHLKEPHLKEPHLKEPTCTW